MSKGDYKVEEGSLLDIKAVVYERGERCVDMIPCTTRRNEARRKLRTMAVEG